MVTHKNNTVSLRVDDEPCPEPLFPKQDAVICQQGVRWTDDYWWLRDPGWTTFVAGEGELSEAVRAQIARENHFVSWHANRLKTVEQDLWSEIRARALPEMETFPVLDDTFGYFQQYRSEMAHPAWCRVACDNSVAALQGIEAPSFGGDRSVLFDGEAVAAGGFLRVVACAPAPDHRRVAVGFDREGGERCAIWIVDATSGRTIDDRVRGCTGVPVWVGDDRFLYLRRSAQGWANQLYLHRVGTDSQDDRLIYEERDPEFFLLLSPTTDRRFAVVLVTNHQVSEVRAVALDEDGPGLVARVVLPREEGVLCRGADHGQGRFVLLASEGDQETGIFGLVPSCERQPLVAPREGVIIREMMALADQLVWVELDTGAPRLGLRRWRDGERQEVTFPEATGHIDLVRGGDSRSKLVRYLYSSPVTPPRAADYHPDTRTHHLRRQLEVPGYQPELFQVQRIFAPAPDGAEIPVTLVLPRARGEAAGPLLLHVYGAYGAIVPARFRPELTSLLERGVGYAVAHVRGGGERGQRWYEAGRHRNRPRAFADYIAVAEHLIALGVTGRGRLIGEAASAGGMVLGTALNLRSDLFAAVLAESPFVDVLASMCDASLPLTAPEWREWGNPLTSREDFSLVRSYSPVDNVRPQRYPAMFVTAALRDTRVPFWEPMRWIARVRENRRGGGPCLLLLREGADHFGCGGRLGPLRDRSLGYAFALDCLAETPAC
jgi:oligopeptidase B